MSENNEFPVDMVYLWCDGKDPEFLQRKAAFSEETEGTARDSFSRIRFFDNEELKYSLRSLEKYAPWIRHVFIVTDRQKPDWLDTENPRVTIVDHSEILPKEIIPCFNSSVIERYIGFIPGLSEYFLYGNDDMFFGQKVSKDFFFRDGKPIVRVRYYQNRKDIRSLAKFRAYVGDDFWGKSVANAHEILITKNQLKDDNPFFELHHNIDAYTKTDFVNAFLKYKDELDQHVSRFRTVSDVQRIFFSLEMLLNKQGELELYGKYTLVKKVSYLSRIEKLESFYAEAKRISMLKLWCICPTLFCINSSGMSEFGNKLERVYLEHRFPSKSSFEK